MKFVQNKNTIDTEDSRERHGCVCVCVIIIFKYIFYLLYIQILLKTYKQNIFTNILELITKISKINRIFLLSF
jgi:hypothetical protein